MALSAVELYERLKPHLGEGETKALIAYVDGKARGEVATKEDIHLLREDLLRVQAKVKDKIREARGELLGNIHGIREDVTTERFNCAHGMLREEIRKCKVLLVALLVEVIVMSPLGLG